MIIAMGSVVIAWILGFLLMQRNLRISLEGKEERMKAYRIYKKEKNRKLAKALGIKYE